MNKSSKQHIRNNYKIIGIFVFLLLLTVRVWAFQPFIAKSIKIQGAQRITRSTILSYLPYHPGERLTSKRAGDIISALYQTGFFENIFLTRQGNALLIKVVERPTIGNIEFSGNSVVKSSRLRTVLKSLGLTKGELLNQEVLASVQRELTEQYYSQGYYNAKVTVTVKPEPRNRVSIKIKIIEGRQVRIRSIHIIGNHVYSQSTLLAQMPISSTNLFSWISGDDKYSQLKLQKSLQALQEYYLDHGYIHFRINSAQAALQPNRRHVYITIRITEGAQYRISGFNLTGNFVVPKAELLKLITLKPGDVFSRKQVKQATKLMEYRLGEEGYAFPIISIIPNVDDNARTVFLTFNINPGQRFYVRRISFTGNYRTSDTVLRREMRQFEGGLYNTKNLSLSKRRLKLLGYFKSVRAIKQPVPGKPDQLDIIYKVNELRSAELTFGIGFSTAQKFIVNAGVQEHNFLGTGRTVGINLQHSQLLQNYSFNYTNPYYTINGVSQSFNVYFTKNTPGRLDLAKYALNQYGISMNYGIPMSEFDFVKLGIGLRHLKIVSGGRAPDQVVEFIDEKGRNFTQALPALTWIHDGLDRRPFPTKGIYQTLGASFAAPLDNRSLIYYKINYLFHWFEPIYDGFIFTFRARLGYGNGIGNTEGLPFFENYFAGGIGTVRGYEDNTLGPQDSNLDPIGANTLIAGTIGIIFPTPLNKYNLRTTLFVDGGNVFQTSRSYGLVTTGIDLNLFRYSVGIDFQWRSPIGPLDISIAQALNPARAKRNSFGSLIRKRDKRAPVQFQIGLGL